LAENSSQKDNYKASKDLTCFLLRNLRNICNAVYYTCDHVTYLNKIKWIPNDKFADRVGYIGCLFWIVNILCTAFSNARENVLLGRYKAYLNTVVDGSGARDDDGEYQKAEEKLWWNKFEMI